jgi:DNA-binding XRE family transcriptional regulator
MTTEFIKAGPFMRKLVGEFNFAMFMRVARTTLGITQAEMARKLGIARGTLCDLEKGRQSVSVAFAAKVAKKAGLSVSQAVRMCLQDQLDRAKIKYKVDLIDKKLA